MRLAESVVVWPRTSGLTGHLSPHLKIEMWGTRPHLVKTYFEFIRAFFALAISASFSSSTFG